MHQFSEGQLSKQIVVGDRCSAAGVSGTAATRHVYPSVVDDAAASASASAAFIVVLLVRFRSRRVDEGFEFWRWVQQPFSRV
ncbi:hypothetical protein AO501_04525 [Mycobacterium gordonae]|uniref:Uncharacterized protein n=1 Tax=Mycobacterium gordonae TaxID=1778 RepID=A0A0Q2MJ74_MYCGO|nr:hypothetical protein AO501_04525 [Mycobacterium gordonae]